MISIRDLSEYDTIIDVKKAYALRRVGTYSPNVVEDIVHTFVPISSFCSKSPQINICVYGSLRTKTNSIPIATILAPHNMVYNQHLHTGDSVSTLISKDITRVLSKYRPDVILKNALSVVHFTNDKFHYDSDPEKALAIKPTTDVIENDSDTHLIHPTTIEIILKQISRNTIGFDYLSDGDLKFFLAKVFSTIDASYSVVNVHEALDSFLQLIIGQTVFALKHCSLGSPDTAAAQHCVVISTLFLRVPKEDTFKFLVYRLIPLPLVHNDETYVYSNLPKFIGINLIDQSFVVWSQETDVTRCKMSTIIQCENAPVIMSVSQSSCLSQLFDDSHQTATLCEVRQSSSIDENVMQIDNGIWYFYNVRRSQHCHIYSSTKDSMATMFITEPTILRASCNKTITCMDVQLPASSCTLRRTIVVSTDASSTRNLPYSMIPMKSTTTSLVSAYKLQAGKHLKELITPFIRNDTTFKQSFHEFSTYVISIGMFILTVVCGYIIKYIKYKISNQMAALESLVEHSINV